MATQKTPTLQIFYILVHLLHRTASTTEKPSTQPLSLCAAYHPSDVLCNNSTRDSRTFACVCYSADASLSQAYPDCYAYVISETLPALRLILAPFKNGMQNLESLSKEMVPLNRDLVSREYYLKRKVSNIISSYCSDPGHSCKSVSRTIHPSNVVILRLACVENDPNQFIVDYTIVKSAETQNLTESSVIEPGLILAALKPKLGRTIPYKVIDHEPHSVVPFPADSESLDALGSWLKLWKQNIGFITGLIIIAALVSIVCLIAVFKALRDRRKLKNRISSPKKETNGVQEKAARYGAMDEHLLDDSPLQKLTTPETDDLAFTTIGITDTSSVEPVPVNGSFAYYPQTPTSPPTRGSSPRLISENSLEFYPPPPEPPPSQSAMPAPAKRTTTTATFVSSSQSMQLQNASKIDQPENGVKKATTFQTFSDKAMRQSSVGSTVQSEPPTPPSMILDDGAPRENAASSDGSRTSTVIQVPVLIVPAMTTHRDDQDYDTPNMPVDEKYVEYDRRNGNSDTEETEYQRRNRRQKDVNPQLRAAVSEECLLPRDPIGNVLSPDQQISSVSSDTGNSDAEGNLDPGGFHLLMSGIGYQPLRESNWSVTGGVRDETNDNENNN